MDKQAMRKRRYSVTIDEALGRGEHLVFTFVPEKRAAGTRKHARQFVVVVREQSGRLSFDWSESPSDPEASREEIEAEITARMKDRADWLDRVRSLVDQVEKWATELNWSTRRVEKKLVDAWIGDHRVPALLMQEDTCRLLLEPIARSAPGAEGVVDLYVMPAYDDIAVLLYYGNRWNLHHNMVRGTNTVVPVREADAIPLSKKTLKKLLAEMTSDAA